MNISAKIVSSFNQHEVKVETNSVSKGVSIPPKATGYGSSVNGGEMLLLALATCFCNDIYHEAAKRNISVDTLEVVCTSEFGAEGEPCSNFQYKVNITSTQASKEQLDELVRHTDKVAEVHNTLRKGVSVILRD